MHEECVMWHKCLQSGLRAVLAYIHTGDFDGQTVFEMLHHLINQILIFEKDLN